jgi:hypothetical protein
MADERTKALGEVADYLDTQAAAADEFFRRFGHLQRYNAEVFYGKADGLREAAVHVRTLAANGKAAAKAEARAAAPKRRGRPPKPKDEAPITTIDAPQPNPKPWEGASL